MSTTTSPMFGCSTCKKQYKWKPEFAGKKVKCKCGNVMTAPAQPPAIPEPEEDDLAGLYDLANEEKKAAKTGAVSSAGALCPSCSASVQVGAVICTNCGLNLKTGQKIGGGGKPIVAAAGARPAAAAASSSKPANPMLGYAGGVRRRDEQTEEENTQLTEIWIPVALIAIGMIASFAKVMYYDRVTFAFPSAIAVVGVTLIIDMVLLAVGCVAAIKAMDVAFGEPGPAALKLCAIAIGPTAISSILAYWLHDSTGAVQWALSLVMIGSLLFWLFHFDLTEIIMFSALMVLIRMWLGTLIAGVILVAILNGYGTSTVGRAALNSDRQAADLIDTGRTVDAEPWLEETANHLFAGMTNADSMTIVKACIDNGCKVADVQVDKSGPTGGTLVAKLPGNSNQRKTIFATVNKVLASYKLPPKTDQGQNYLYIDFY